MYKQEPYLSEYIDVRAGVYFKPFYNVLADCGVRKLKSSLTDMRETYSENIYADFTQYLAEQLQEICMRTLIVEMHIDDLEKKHVSQMSGGEQQRIAIMRAIINKPQILLADEPTGNLDKENSQTIMNLFERLNKQGMTIVMVTHDTSLAKYGTRVVRVEDGRIIEKGKEILK